MSTRRVLLESQVFKLELGVFLDVCEAVNTPRSLACYLLGKHGEWQQYLDLSRPDALVSTFADDYLVSEMLTKNPHLPLGIDREAAAFEKFLEAERECYRTNERLRLYEKGSFCPLRHVDRTVKRARSLISSILGPLSRKDVEFAESRMRFGPGATSAVSGRDVVLSRKIASCNIDATPRLAPYVNVLRGHPWGDIHGVYRVVDYSKVVCVPKNAKTDRVIAIEPHMNIYVQLGIGALLRSKLLRSGLNLNSQQRNQDLARLAHKAGLCTIDLSSASDSIARELVPLLLPIQWVQLLDLPRTEFMRYDGATYHIEKFSAMGNGYTFELESLIFWALARASGDDDAVSYGDDIILNQGSAVTLMETLTFLGFKVNAKKTFMAGCFFESCGTDWWHGKDVRPFYLKGVYHDRTSAVIRIANAIRKYSHRRNLGLGCDLRFRRPWVRVATRSPQAMLTYLPLDFGDDGLIRNFDEATPSKARHGIEGWMGKVWRGKPSPYKNTSVPGAYIAALIWGTPEISRVNETVRGQVLDATMRDQLVPRWSDLGPWQ